MTTWESAESTKVRTVVMGNRRVEYLLHRAANRLSGATAWRRQLASRTGFLKQQVNDTARAMCVRGEVVG